MTKSDRLRMAQWLAASVILYVAALLVPVGNPVSTLLWKLGHVTVAGHVGYWLSRHALGRITGDSLPTDRLARAVIIGAAMLAVSMGM